jgi:hypothetical protein
VVAEKLFGVIPLYAYWIYRKRYTNLVEPLVEYDKNKIELGQPFMVKFKGSPYRRGAVIANFHKYFPIPAFQVPAFQVPPTFSVRYAPSNSPFEKNAKP